MGLPDTTKKTLQEHKEKHFDDHGGAQGQCMPDSGRLLNHEDTQRRLQEALDCHPGAASSGSLRFGGQTHALEKAMQRVLEGAEISEDESLR